MVELVQPIKRVEQYLYALCVLDFSNIPVPRSRLEIFTHAMITGEVPEIAPETREEEYMVAIIKGDVSNLPTPKSRADHLLYRICLGETEIRDVELETRYEMLLAYLAEHGGTDLEYALINYTAAFKTLYNTVEMPVKSAILKGQTLVNLLNPVKTQSKNNYVQNFQYGLKELTIIITNKTVDKYPRLSIYDSNTKNWLINIDPTFTGNKLHYVAKDGEYVNGMVFTTYGGNNIYDYSSLDEYLLQQIMVLNGDYTNVDIPYFEGMQSVKMPVLTTTGRNVLNPKRFVSTINTSSNDGVVININNQIEDLNFRSLYDELTLPVDTYTITCEVVNGTYLGGNLCIYDENNKNIREFAFKNGSGSTTITSSINKLRLWNAYGTDNCQIRVAITKDGSTTYEPYKTNILTVNEDVELRGIGDVRDELNCLTGEVTERIGEVVLDGSEDWILGSGFSSNENGNFECKNINIGNRYNKVISTHFNYDSGTDDRERVRATNSNYIVIYINKTRLESPTVDGFKKWLITQKNSGNPVKVQYQLLEKSIKTVVLTTTDQDNQPTQLKTFNDVTYVETQADSVLPTVILEYGTKNQEVLAALSQDHEEVADAQAALSDAIDSQSDEVETTMMALTEVYEGGNEE